MVDKTDSQKARKAANYDYTTVERKKKYRQNMREQGFVLKQFFVHEDDWDEIKNILQEKRDARRT